MGSINTDHPDCGVKKLRKLNSGGRFMRGYARNDYPWLMRHCPEKGNSY